MSGLETFISQSASCTLHTISVVLVNLARATVDVTVDAAAACVASVSSARRCTNTTHFVAVNHLLKFRCANPSKRPMMTKMKSALIHKTDFDRAYVAID